MGGTNSVAVPWAGRAAGRGARSGGAGSVTHALPRGASFDRTRASRVPLALLFVVQGRVSVECGGRAQNVPRPRQGSAWCWQSSAEGQQPNLDVARRLKGQVHMTPRPSNPQAPEPPLVKGEGAPGPAATNLELCLGEVCGPGTEDQQDRLRPIHIRGVRVAPGLGRHQSRALLG